MSTLTTTSKPVLSKIKSLKDGLYYSFGKEEFPSRLDDLYTDGVSLKMMDYGSIPADTRIINNVEAQMDRIVENTDVWKDIFHNTAETFSFIASCDYGCMKGNFYEGTKCPTCGTYVKTIDPDVLKFNAMFHLPEDYPAIIHPTAYKLLDYWFGGPKGKRTLEAMLLNKRNFPQALTDAGFKFGLTAFREDFDKICEFFLTRSKFVPAETVKKGLRLVDIIHNNKDTFFIRNVPILNKTLHIITRKKSLNKNRKKGFSESDVLDKKNVSYTDSQAEIICTMNNILDEIVTNKMADRSVNLDSKMFVFSRAYYQYVKEIIDKKLSKKKGYIQQNVIAGRFFNTFRGVISPHGHEGAGDELHLPWKMGVTAHKLEILNLLQNRYGYTQRDALDLFFKSKEEYSAVIHEILDTLVAECPYKGLPVEWDRNPSIDVGSEQLIFVTKFKSDTHDKTISMSQIIVNAPNADSKSGSVNEQSLHENFFNCWESFVDNQQPTCIRKRIPYKKYIIYKSTIPMWM